MQRQTSLEAYRELVVPRLGRLHLCMLQAFRRLGGRATDWELSEKLRWPINCVTPRRWELVDAGEVAEEGFETVLLNGRHVRRTVWGLTK